MGQYKRVGVRVRRSREREKEREAKGVTDERGLLRWQKGTEKQHSRKN